VEDVGGESQVRLAPPPQRLLSDAAFPSHGVSTLPALRMVCSRGMGRTTQESIEAHRQSLLFDPSAVVYSRRLDPWRSAADDDPQLQAGRAVAAAQSLGWSRIVNKPGKKVGHINFVLCTPHGTPAPSRRAVGKLLWHRTPPSQYRIPSRATPGGPKASE
jgi:hypothetical protein